MYLYEIYEIVVNGHACILVVMGMCYMKTQASVKVKLSFIWRTEIMQVWNIWRGVWCPIKQSICKLKYANFE